MIRPQLRTRRRAGGPLVRRRVGQRHPLQSESVPLNPADPIAVEIPEPEKISAGMPENSGDLKWLAGSLCPSASSVKIPVLTPMYSRQDTSRPSFPVRDGTTAIDPPA